jgi:diguanylate cyclase (GGDEF)-like protein/PAS domain S-box-containing protein
MTAPEVLDSALKAVLDRDPDAFVTAMGGDGFRVPMPDSFDLAGHRAIPVPPDRATMVDLIRPEDSMTTITIWEQAAAKGMAFGVVRTRSDPDRAVTLALIDARHRHGVWFGILTDRTDGDPGLPDQPAVAGLGEPNRPRTATMYKDSFAHITAIDERATRMLGWAEDQLVGVRSLEFIHPDDHQRAIANWMEMLSQRDGGRVRYRHRCQNGDWLWVEAESTYQCDDADPDAFTVIVRLSDISDEMAAQEAVSRRERMFHRLAESLPSGLFQIDSDRSVVYANAKLAEILGVPTATNLTDQLRAVVDEDRVALDAALDTVLDQGRDQELEVGVRLPETGELRRCTVTLVALPEEPETVGAIVTVYDITESARMREELKIRATYDALTGCHNRASITAILDQELTATAHDCRTAVVFIDLDGLKDINDELGHATGDELLRHAAECLSRLARKNDAVGRIGGDEFLLVCRDITDPTEALSIAERVSGALHHKVEILAEWVELSASIGFAVSRAGSTSDTLVAEADSAMYESKRLGVGAPVLFDEAFRDAGK